MFSCSFTAFLHIICMLLLLSCLQTTEPDGKKIRRVIYQHPGSDVTGMLARSEKVAGACEQVIIDRLDHVFRKSKRLLSFIRQQSQTERRYVV